jgi:hypothetical protein
MGGTPSNLDTYSPAIQEQARKWVADHPEALQTLKRANINIDDIDPTNITVRRKKKAPQGGGGGGGEAVKKLAKARDLVRRSVRKLSKKKLSVPTEEKGTGLKHRRVVRGRGIGRNSSPRWTQFGRYILHMPSLKTYVLNVKYPSQASIPALPKVDLSEELRDLLVDLTNTGRLDQRLYAALSKEDKHTFDTLAHRAQVDEQLGLRYSVSMQEQKDDLKQFEIVRGEILAGNDAPELLKELKNYVLKFLREGTISKTEAADLLSELSAV